MHFSRLRLSGFKSFVDPTELVIEPGLTGIVGPNGCGKSNLVEALRWVMGETSAKRMRGGEMDDVIFGGTANRPARNLAEVSLLLHEVDRRAPIVLDRGDDIEVVRRIERGSGSGYRINGKEVRARDVQLLFADAATGAQSTALVSQGRIGALINAKPVERRGLLEEAAGIGGLHSRRHEAELRLKAAEANLSRLDDVIVTLQAQFDTLRKQARQAGRYRRLSEHIRHAEAILLHLLWRQAEAASNESAASLRDAERRVGELTAAALATEREREAASTALPPLRQAEVAAAAELQRLIVTREQLDAEERRVQASRSAAEQRLVQLAQDRKREDDLAADAAAALARLGDEKTAIAEAQQRETATLAEAAARVEEAGVTAAACEAELGHLTEEVAATEARRGALVRQSKEAEDRLKRLAARLAEAQRQRDSLAAEAVDESTLAAAAGAVAAAEAKTEEARRSADAAEDALSGAEAAEAEAREAAQAAEAAHTRLRTEAQALEQLLAGGADTHKAPVLDQIKVEPGFEAALAAALGDDLSAPLDGTAPRHWDGLAPYDSAPQLPPGVAPLATRVAATAVLARRLAQIGIVSDAAEADRLRAALLPGQRLVTCEGGLWRWDGFVACAGAPTAAAQRLRQRNRLDTLTAALASAKAEADRLKATLEAARMESRRCAEHARAARQSARDTINELGRVRDAQAALAQRATAASSRLTALAETIGLVQAELKEVEAQRTAASEAIRVLPDAALGRDALATLRARVSDKRTAYLSAQSDHDRLVRDAQARVQRLASIGLEERSWDGRAEAAARQRESLDQRRVALEREITALDSRPGEIGAQRETLAETIARATAKRGAAGDALAVAETRLAEAEKAARAAEASLAAEREERVRREAAVSHATEALETLRRRIAERLDCAPEGVLAEAGVGADDPLPTIADAEARVERLTRERDSMGPVNLVAESEAAEVESRVQALEAERADLTAAIARLRQGIGALNREGRERLLAAFAQVNEHFEKLFVRLFGGGGAHLILDEGQDPLEAGLEIMASPPGKRLQTLSLLSGGEQALTALALLFAVFLTNPAPICVLDEVDAPLDDANVDRFCRLVEEIADSATTRFLVITHHRITMARMDRLFGVTMAERGVSQLVSVDLHGAERLRKTA